MPKRSLDIEGSGRPEVPEKIQRKTERSHEENQERAYIAASRRADRSIEARVQSAKMASEIHKKRTGKSFRISEDIVRKEEMYEEEEDEFPRSYRLLGPHMQTNSAEMNSRVEAYLSNRMAMSAYMSHVNDSWRENHINRLFAASFPNMALPGHASRMPSVASPAATAAAAAAAQPQSPQGQTTRTQSVASPAFSTVNYQQGADRTPISACVSPIMSSPGKTGMPPASPAVATTSKMGQGSIDARSMMPATWIQPSAIDTKSSISAASATTADLSSPDSSAFGAMSSFTPELPNEMKLFMPHINLENNPYMQQGYYGRPFDSGAASSFYPEAEFDPLAKHSQVFGEEDDPDYLADDTFSWDNYTNLNDDNTWAGEQ